MLVKGGFGHDEFMPEFDAQDFLHKKSKISS